MLTHILIITLLLAGTCIIAYRHLSPRALVRTLAGGFLAINGLLVLLALGLAVLLWVDAPAVTRATPLLQENEPAQQEAENQAEGQSSAADLALGAALATGLAAIGAGYAVAVTGSAAIGAIAEKPEVFGRTLIFVGLAEGIAIYGLIIAFLILTGGFGGG